MSVLRKSVVVLLVALAGCGGGAKRQSAAAATAACLNERGFLVQAGGRALQGTSPSGVGFTVTISPGKPARIDASGNPSSAKLSPTERASIGTCLGKAVH